MSYKKFIKRGGKNYGPYIYQSRKENGKVITEYLGKHDGDLSSKSNIWNVLLWFGIGMIVLLLFFFSYNLTGRATLHVENNYFSGEQIKGNLELSLKQGELLPASTKILVDNAGEVSEFSLSEMISENIIEGDFYAEGVSISGTGQGYGIIGEKKIYPTVYFKLKIIKDKEEESEEIDESGEVKEDESVSEQTEQEVNETVEETESSGQQPSEAPVTEETTEETETPSEETASETTEGISESELTTESEDTTTESSSSESESESVTSEESSSPITGEAVKEDKEKNENLIDGSVSKDSKFVYTLSDGKSAKIKKESVRVDYVNKKGKIKKEKISDDSVNLKVSGGEAIVTTNYYDVEEGFGAEYLSDDKFVLSVDLSHFGLVAKEGNLVIRLVYGETEIVSVSKMINVEGEIVNETEIPEQNATKIPEENQTEISEQNITEIPEQNVTEIIPGINETLINRSLLQYRAIIGRPVKWIKVVKISNENNSNIEIPKSANNISLKIGDEIQQALNEIDTYENIVENADRNGFVDGTITGMVGLDISENKGFFRKFIDWISGFMMTGNVIQENEFQDSIFETADNKIVEVGKIFNITGEMDIAVEYYTKSSLVIEENLTNGKRIRISADDAFNYTNILAYTLIDRQISVGEMSKIKMYWYDGLEKTSVNFSAYDLDSDGFVDYVEWIVPHLSEQIYEIIYITKAEHLDSNRSFVSDIYDEVKEQDNVWSEPITDGDYVRVTFEKPLDKTKDITIYARSSCSSGIGFIAINGTEVPCDIYLKKKRIDEVRGLLG